MDKETVLLISGSHVLMDITKRILERAGYTVRCAAGFVETRAQLIDFSPDKILLEADISEGDSFEFCRELCSKTQAPIMFMSGKKEDELPALQAGASDFLKKPCDYEILKARLDKLSAKMTRDSGSVQVEARAVELPPEEESRLKPDLQEPLVKDAVPKQRRGSAKWIRHTLLAASLILVAVFAFVASNGSPPQVILPDEPVPLGAAMIPMDEHARPYTGDETGISLPLFGDVTIGENENRLPVLLLNPSTNRCYLAFTILMDETGETLYKSGMMAPGTYNEEAILSKGLAKGDHSAIMRIYVYSENYLFLGTVDILFKISTY